MQKSSSEYVEEFIQEDKKIEKWTWVIQNWETVFKKHKQILKVGVRSGIPDMVRGHIWQNLIGSSLRPKEENVEAYMELLEQENPEYENLILNDIHRTFPKHPLFINDGGLGQTALYNILKGYAIKNKDVGYCQGMGFLSAIFLSYMNEESSFWFLHHLVKKHQLQGFYQHSMTALNVAFYVLQSLIKKFLPKIYTHFNNIKLQPSMYASQWFLTLFALNFPFESFVRIWDIYFYEGAKTIYRFGIAILMLNEDRLLVDDFEKIMKVFKDMYKTVDIPKLISTALNLKITNRNVKNLENEYTDMPNKEIMDNLLGIE